MDTVDTLIKVDVKNIDSLKEGLETFTKHMREAYKTGELRDKVGGFVSDNNTLFQNSDLADAEQLKMISCFGNVNDPGYDQSEDLSELEYWQLNRGDVYLRYSHMVVFQNALAHDELKEPILTFCKELVEYSTTVGSNELFFSSRAYFGIYILVLLVEKYPEYAYMIGEFIDVDGDYDQIKFHCASYVTYLFDKYKYGSIIIDILTNCRFDYLRSTMSDGYIEDYYPNLLQYFLEDEKNLATYKKAFVKAIERNPVDPESIESVFDMLEEDFDSYDVEEFNFSDNDLELYNTTEEFEDILLHGKKISELSKEIHAELFDAVKNIPLSKFSYYSDPIYNETTTLLDIQNDPFYQPYKEHNHYETNKEFFLQGFDNGQDILDYIEKNKNLEILDSIYPTNLRILTLKKKLYIYKRFEYHGSGILKLSNDLSQDVELEDILNKLLVTYKNPEIFDIENDGQVAQDQKCLRCVDVLVRLLDIKELNNDSLQVICSEFELCSKEVAQERYKLKELNEDEIKDIFYSIVNDDTESLGTENLEVMYNQYKRAPALIAGTFVSIIQKAYDDADKNILACVPALNQTEFARGPQLLGASYILYKESYSESDSDELKLIWDFYSEQLFKVFNNLLKESHVLPFYDDEDDEDDEDIEYNPEYEEYEEPVKFLPLIEKVEAYLESQELSGKDEAYTCARTLLGEEDEDGDGGILIAEATSTLLASILYAAKVAPAPLRKKLLAIYNLMLHLFPSKTLLVSFYEFSKAGEYSPYERTSDEVTQFCDVLTSLGIDEKYILLAKIVIIQGEYDSRRNEWLSDLYQTLITRYQNRNDMDSDVIESAVELMYEESQEIFLDFSKQFKIIEPAIIDLESTSKTKNEKHIQEAEPTALTKFAQELLDGASYVDLMSKYDVDGDSILKYLVANDLVQHLARQIDISKLIPSLNVTEQLTVLSALATLPYYHHVIVSNQAHESIEIQAHTRNLMFKNDINDLPNDAYKISDFGIYKMGGALFSSQTEIIEAELGKCFGFRFKSVDSEHSELLAHHVVVKYPTDKTDRLITQWKQNGDPKVNIFLGWNFETPDELIAGEYEFEAYDDDWKLIAKKTITVQI